MNNSKLPTQLHLTVTNLKQLMHGCRHHHRFDALGGSVGCEYATWMLRDNHGRIARRHFDIDMRDGHFCVTDTSGLTRLNGDPQPMGLGRTARLGTGDEIDIGPYRLKVLLSESTAEDPMGHAAARDPERLRWEGTLLE